MKLLICGETKRVDQSAKLVRSFNRGHPFRAIQDLHLNGKFPLNVVLRVFVSGVGLVEDTSEVDNLIHRPDWISRIGLQLKNLSPEEVFLFLSKDQMRIILPCVERLNVPIIRPEGSPGQRVGKMLTWLREEYASTTIQAKSN